MLYAFPAARLEERSFIGQAFDVSAALFTSFALMGVLLTLLLQRRDLSLQNQMLAEMKKDVQRSSESAFRSLHVQLTSLAFQDPELLEVWRYDTDQADFSPSGLKKELYANLVVSHVETSYLAGLVTEDALRVMLREIFESVTIREYWQRVAQLRALDLGDDAVMLDRFVEIANAEFRRAQPATSSLENDES